MPLPTPKPPTADGNPPEYDAMKDLAERCAKAEAELRRVQKQSAAMRGALSRIDARVRVSEIMPDAGWVMSLTADALQPNAGSDYIHKDKAQSQLDAMAAVVKSAYVHKDQVKPLIECLHWLHAGSICADPSTSSASRKDCPICKALNHAKSIGL